MPLISLLSSDEAYLKAFEVFLRHVTARQAILKIINENTAEAVKRSENSRSRRRNGENGGPRYSVLGVGSADGQNDLVILGIITKHLSSLNQGKPEVFSRIIEPNTHELQAFKAAVTQIPLSVKKLAELSFEWVPTTFQEYSNNRHQPNSFNLIHFIHSLYYMDAESTLLHCYDKELKRNGVILCLVQTEDSYFPKMRKKYLGMLNFGLTFYTTEEIVSIAKKHFWKHELRTSRFRVDITKCYDETSEEGSLLLDFLTHQQNFRLFADRELLASMMAFLTDMSQVDEKGSRHLNGEMGAVFIYKQE